MLKLKYLFENFELATYCLARYDCDEASLSRMLPHFRISSNAVYPFREGTDPRKVLFLRLTPLEEKPLARVLSEIRLLQWLLDNGYPAMRPVPMKDGQFAVALDTAWGRYAVSCYARVPGEALDDIGGTPDLVRGYGRSLGALHSALRRYPAADEYRDHNALLAEIRARLQQYGAPAFMLRELALVEAELAALPAGAGSYGLIHYDFEPDNVFFDSETGVYSAIDFDDALRCWFSLDIVRALDALDDVVGEADAAAGRRVFLEGYREARPLSEADENAMPLMRRLVALQQYATLLHALSEPTQTEPEWLLALRDKLTGRLRQIEAAAR